MTYTSNELSQLTGYALSTISSSLRTLGFQPVAIVGKNQNLWDEECLKALQRKKRIQERESTILLTSLASAYNITVPEMRSILKDKGFEPAIVEHNDYNGTICERYPLEVREVIAKHFDDLKADNADEHPLITDKRCLKLNWWPDIIPKCFEDLDDIA